MKANQYRRFKEVAASVFILLFTYTGISKLIDHNAFEVALRSSPVKNWAELLLWLIPVIEMLTALILLLPSTRTIGFYISFALMVSFSAYIGLMIYSPAGLPCSCGGFLEQLSWNGHLVLNLILAILAGTILIMETKRIHSQ
jgi:hypothetical protein